MNPLTNMKNQQKMNERELALGMTGTSSSWHSQYDDSAWVFTGGLPYELTEGDVICIFSQYGEIVNINLVRDKDTGKSRGYAFICYEDQRSTILAVDNLNGAKVLNRAIRVDHKHNYQVPKEKGTEDDLTMALRERGCAPSVVHTIATDINVDADDDSKQKKKEKKKKKKEKKKKKKKEKCVKKRNESESSSESSESDSELTADRNVKTESDRNRQHVSPVRIKQERVDPDSPPNSGIRDMRDAGSDGNVYRGKKRREDEAESRDERWRSVERMEERSRVGADGSVERRDGKARESGNTERTGRGGKERSDDAIPCRTYKDEFKKEAREKSLGNDEQKRRKEIIPVERDRSNRRSSPSVEYQVRRNENYRGEDEQTSRSHDRHSSVENRKRRERSPSDGGGKRAKDERSSRDAKPRTWDNLDSIRGRIHECETRERTEMKDRDRSMDTSYDRTSRDRYRTDRDRDRDRDSNAAKCDRRERDDIGRDRRDRK